MSVMHNIVLVDKSENKYKNRVPEKSIKPQCSTSSQDMLIVERDEGNDASSMSPRITRFQSISKTRKKYYKQFDSCKLTLNSRQVAPLNPAKIR